MAGAAVYGVPSPTARGVPPLGRAVSGERACVGLGVCFWEVRLLFSCVFLCFLFVFSGVCLSVFGVFGVAAVCFMFVVCLLVGVFLFIGVVQSAIPAPTCALVVLHDGCGNRCLPGRVCEPGTPSRR